MSPTEHKIEPMGPADTKEVGKTMETIPEPIYEKQEGKDLEGN